MFGFEDEVTIYVMYSEFFAVFDSKIPQLRTAVLINRHIVHIKTHWNDFYVQMLYFNTYTNVQSTISNTHFVSLSLSLSLVNRSLCTHYLCFRSIDDAMFTNCARNTSND